MKMMILLHHHHQHHHHLILSLTLPCSDVFLLTFVSLLALGVHTALVQAKAPDKAACIAPFIIVLK